jgi:hypothetical protein
MGLVTGDQRGALLDLAARAAKRTSFGRQLAQQATIYDRARAQQSRLDDLSAAVAPAAPGSEAATSQTLTEVKIVAKLPPGQGFKPAGWYHHLAIDFSLGEQADNVPSPAFTTDDEKAERDAWGTSWEKDLVNPRMSTVYMVRCTLTQLRVEPLLGGFILKWARPTFGWKWIDGQTARTPVQVVSNPLVVTRLVLAPSTTIVNGGGFVVSIVAQYP